jgi:hypothetical protein
MSSPTLQTAGRSDSPRHILSQVESHTAETLVKLSDVIALVDSEILAVEKSRHQNGFRAEDSDRWRREKFEICQGKKYALHLLREKLPQLFEAQPAKPANLTGEKPLSFSASVVERSALTTWIEALKIDLLVARTLESRDRLEDSIELLSEVLADSVSIAATLLKFEAQASKNSGNAEEQPVPGEVPPPPSNTAAVGLAFISDEGVAMTNQADSAFGLNAAVIVENIETAIASLPWHSVTEISEFCLERLESSGLATVWGITE